MCGGGRGGEGGEVIDLSMCKRVVKCIGLVEKLLQQTHLGGGRQGAEGSGGCCEVGSWRSDFSAPGGGGRTHYHPHLSTTSSPLLNHYQTRLTSLPPF
jgi:hypothetical protein